MKTAGEQKNVRDAGKDIKRLSMVIFNDCNSVFRRFPDDNFRDNWRISLEKY